MADEKWSARLQDIELKVKQARKAGDPDALISVAKDALQNIETRLAAAPDLGVEEKTETLKAYKRIGYNAAADIYPGWELDTPPRSVPQLSAAIEFAEKSAAAVEQLGQGPAQRGNAIWLLGALDLASGDASKAVPAFRQAAEIFGQGPEPEMQLMALGFAAIAGHARAEFDAAMAGLKNLGSEDAADFQAQLEVAAKIFAL